MSYNQNWGSVLEPGFLLTNQKKNQDGDSPQPRPGRSLASDISAAALVALSLVFPAEEALAERRAADLSSNRLPPVPAQIHSGSVSIREAESAVEDRYLREFTAARKFTPIQDDIAVEYRRLGPIRGIAGSLSLEHVQDSGAGTLYGQFKSENGKFESFEFRTPAVLNRSDDGLSISIGGANFNLNIPFPIPIKSRYRFTLARDAEGDPKMMLEVKLKSNSVKVTHTLYF